MSAAILEIPGRSESAMRPTVFRLVPLAALLSMMLTGCGGQAPPPPQVDVAAPEAVPPVAGNFGQAATTHQDVQVRTAGHQPAEVGVGPKSIGAGADIDAGKQEQYDTLLLEALSLLADRKYSDALSAF